MSKIQLNNETINAIADVVVSKIIKIQEQLDNKFYDDVKEGKVQFTPELTKIDLLIKELNWLEEFELKYEMKRTDALAQEEYEALPEIESVLKMIHRDIIDVQLQIDELKSP